MVLRKHSFQFVRFASVRYREAVRSAKASINDDCHLLHITRGVGGIHLDMLHGFDLAPGTVIAIPPGVPYTMRIEPDFEMLNLHYHLWLEDGQPLGEVGRLSYCFHPAYFPETEAFLRKMEALPPGGGPDDWRRSVYAYQVVLQHYACSEWVHPESRPADGRIVRAAEYLKSKTRAPYDIAELERVSCLSRSQLNRKFREVHGVAPHHFWDRQRLRAICMDVKSRRRSLCQIAEEYGFSSPGYFSRWFKKNTGFSPAVFRQKQGAF